MSAFTPSIPVLLSRRTPCSNTAPCMSAQRPRRSNRRPPKRQPSPQSQPQGESPQFFSEEPDTEEISDVDDGFFSRYMRDRDHEKPDEPLPRQRMDRETAASAFDALDKLFGSIKAGEKGEERRKWLDDVQARAATTEESSRRADALDVTAADVDRDEFSEAKIEGDTAESSDSGRKSGFKDQKDKSTDDKYSFDLLMKVARRGPPGDNRRRARPRENDRDSRQGRRASTPSGETKRSSDFSHLLGLTKRIIDRKDENNADDYEPIDDEMEKTIEFRGAKRKDVKRRQKFTAVRRIGGQSRRIFTPPNEWLPLTEGDVEGLKSDHRSFGNKGRDGKLKGVVAECHECRGTGLDTCVACLGAGWIQPLKDDIKLDDDRRAILEEMWNRPNLVVDIEGEAQCVRCNGVGKQFCKKCQGSGSALRKGFSFSERDEVFGMFVNVEGGEVGEDDDDEYDDDEDEEEEDEAESFQLYQGSGETFDFMRKKRGKGDGKDADDEEDQDVDVDDVDVDDVDDVIEVEDESTELLAALEAMHLADIEERKTGKRPSRRDLLVSRIAVDDDDDEDDVDDVDVDVDDDEDSDDDFSVGLDDPDTEDLEDLDDDEDDDDDDDDDFGDIDEEDIAVDMTFAGEDEDEDIDSEDEDDEDEDVNEESFNGYD